MGAASELNNVYYNYQKQIQSKEGKLETYHSDETQILEKSIQIAAQNYVSLLQCQPSYIFSRNNLHLHTS